MNPFKKLSTKLLFTFTFLILSAVFYSMVNASTYPIFNGAATMDFSFLNNKTTYGPGETITAIGKITSNVNPRPGHVIPSYTLTAKTTNVVEPWQDFVNPTTSSSKNFTAPTALGNYSVTFKYGQGCSSYGYRIDPLDGACADVSGLMSQGSGRNTNIIGLSGSSVPAYGQTFYIATNPNIGIAGDDQITTGVYSLTFTATARTGSNAYQLAQAAADAINNTSKATWDAAWIGTSSPGQPIPFYPRANVRSNPSGGYMLETLVDRAHSFAGSASHSASSWTINQSILNYTVATALNAVTISDTAKVGQTLTATVSPASAANYVTYRWERLDCIDTSNNQDPCVDTWVSISGATSKTFIPSLSDVDSSIRVVATSNGSGPIAAGSVYSSSVTIATNVVATAPSVTTSAVTGINQTSATSGGNVTSNGGSTVTLSGLVWSTSSNPVVDSLALSQGRMTTDGWYIGGPWPSNMTGLTAGTAYHVRAYATNGIGISYGSDVTFTTKPASTIATVSTPLFSSVSSTTATLGATVDSLGNPATITARGVCYRGYGTASRTDNGASTCVAATGTTTGAFTVNVTGLTSSSSYNFIGYADHSQGPAMTSQGTFTTTALPNTIAKVSTPVFVTMNSSTSVTLGATVDTLGNPAKITARGICYRGYGTPSRTDSQSTCVAEGGTSVGSFTLAISGLSPSVTYNFIGYADHSQGPAMTIEMGSFTTPAPGNSIATVSTPVSSNLTSNSVTLGATVDSLGYPAKITARGVCYRGYGTPSRIDPLSTCLAATGTTTGAFTVNITGLNPSVSYNFIGYADHSMGPAMSTQGSFTTPAASKASGTISVSGCSIDTSKSVCLASATWTSSNLAPGTFAIMRNNPNTTLVATNTTGTNISHAVTYGVTNYYLYNNGAQIFPAVNGTQVTNTIGCTLSTDSWNGTICIPTVALNVAKNGTGTGTITAPTGGIGPLANGINCGTNCSELYTIGAAVTLTAIPDNGSTFAGWSGPADCSDGSITMNVAKSCGATFNISKTPLISISLAGSAQVGQTLTSTLVPSGATATYQWAWVESGNPTVNISGATSSSYTLVNSDLGKYVAVIATGNGNYSGTVTMSTGVRVTAVTPGTTPLTSVTLSGAVQIGQKLTSAIAPSGATATYQWYSSPNADGSSSSLISGSTSSTYTLASTDAGKYIVLLATGTGSYSGTVKAVTSTKVPGGITPLANITLSGTVQSGKTITSTLLPSGATASYQWYSSTGSDGSGPSVIPGATSNSYTVDNSYVGKYIFVIATGTGSYSGTAFGITSTQVVPVGTTPLTGIILSGTVQSGKTLTSTVAPSGATVTYQWYSSPNSNGSLPVTTILGAISSTYTIDSSYEGQYIFVVATGNGSYSGTAFGITSTSVIPGVVSKVNGVCSSTHYECIAGTSFSNLSNVSTWTWTCGGLNGGTDDNSCSQAKGVPPPSCPTIDENFCIANCSGWFTCPGGPGGGGNCPEFKCPSSQKPVVKNGIDKCVDINPSPTFLEC